jgi:hypothetical protein
MQWQYPVSYYASYKTRRICLTEIAAISVERLAILFRVREISGSIIGKQTGSSNKYSVGFLNPYRKIMGTYLKIGHDGFTPCTSLFNIHNQHPIRCCIKEKEEEVAADIKLPQPSESNILAK